MHPLLMAGFGGLIGTIMRYLLNEVVYKIFNAPLYPYGTLIINVIGCLLIGLIAGLAESRVFLTPNLRIFIQIGLLGGFTTFSTFSYETFTLMNDGQLVLGLTNVLLQVILGLIAVWIGYHLGN